LKKRRAEGVKEENEGTGTRKGGIAS